MKTVIIFDRAGAFAENKDVARQLRTQILLPELERGGKITLDFDRVDSATQSFVHALISDAIRKQGSDVLDRIEFKNCNITIKKIINIVTDYMQESA